MFKVYNETQGYTEHVGSLESCERWIQNVRDLGFSTDTFVIQPSRKVQ